MAIKRDELANPNSCLNKAKDDEPIFVLRANDETGPEVVEAWANAYVRLKGGMQNMTVVQRAKYREALELAKEMRTWKLYN